METDVLEDLIQALSAQGKFGSARDKSRSRTLEGRRAVAYPGRQDPYRPRLLFAASRDIQVQRTRDAFYDVQTSTGCMGIIVPRLESFIMALGWAVLHSQL